MYGTVWCRNIETECPKQLKRLEEDRFSQLSVGSRIVFLDHGWFCSGNHLVRIIDESVRGG